jgi:hypothetical protein
MIRLAYIPKIMALVQNPATVELLGKPVVVYPAPGADPITGLITKIDPFLGLIIEVTIKDGVRKGEVIEVKNLIVRLIEQVPYIVRIAKMIAGWFKKKPKTTV